MRIVHDSAYPGRSAPALVIMLPGALQQPEDFVRSGFVEAVRQRALAIDLSLVDLGLRYITDTTDGTALQRIHDGVVQTAHGGNYREIWLAGISIGGFLAMAYTDRFVGRVDGLCLLAPYPGDRMLTGEIMAAGGIAHWQDTESDDAERRVWQWLKTCRAQAQAPEIHLGYGRDDRFASGQHLMAEAIGADRVNTIAGGHDWPVWQQLWINFLDRTGSRFGHVTLDAAG
jgi:pimeloyl-ACP methyl ester carboxylesterase